MTQRLRYHARASSSRCQLRAGSPCSRCNAGANRASLSARSQLAGGALLAAAQGQRFLASSGHSLPLIEVARTLKTHLAAEAEKVSLQPMSDAMVRAAAVQNPLMTSMVKLLGVDMNVSAAKAGWLLNWHPRSPQEAILATARSLLALGLAANH